MSIKSFQDAHAALAPFIPLARSIREAYTLERMKMLMERLGNPQDSFKTLHVAGTSGKTSTAYYTAAMLTAAGRKTGLIVSPHIDQINERVQLNMTPLSETEFAAELEVFMGIIEASQLKPTYFELLVAFAYWVFARAQVEYAVVEVGLGGLLDGTNVIHRADKVCVITDIGLDHTHILGKTLPAITAQKAGIIHSHNIVVMYEQAEEVMQVVREVAEREQAELHEIWPLAAKELPRNLPIFQRRNWYLALSAYEIVRQRDNLPLLDEAALEHTTRTYIPARMEVLQRSHKPLVLDGGHNAQKISTLVGSLRARYPKQSFAIMLGLGQGKNFRLKTTLKPVLELADHVVFTAFADQGDFEKQSLNPLKLAEYADVLGFSNWEIIAEPKAAYRSLMARPEDVKVVTGSFYLLHAVRQYIHANKLADGS